MYRPRRPGGAWKIHVCFKGAKVRRLLLHPSDALLEVGSEEVREWIAIAADDGGLKKILIFACALGFELVGFGTCSAVFQCVSWRVWW